MIFKSKYFMIIVVICILFSMTAVSADSVSNQTDVLESDVDLQSGTDLNRGDLGDGQSEYSFRDLDHDIKNCSGTLNMEHDYVCSEELDSFKVFVNDSLVINGNGHCLDAANFDSMISIDADKTGVGGNNISVAINDVTFKNFPKYALYLCKGKVTLNNVSFINVSGSSKVFSSIFVDSNVELILNNSNIHCTYGNTFM